MNQWSSWAAIIGGLLWLVKGTAILLIGVQPPVLFEIAPLFFAVGLWGVYKVVDGRTFRLAQLALLLAILAGLSAIIVTLAQWFSPHLLPDGTDVTIVTPFFVLAGFGTLLALLLLGIVARRTRADWSRLLIMMAVGFPLLTALLGMIGTWTGNDRLIEIPVILMGAAWIQIGLRLRPYPYQTFYTEK